MGCRHRRPAGRGVPKGERRPESEGRCHGSHKVRALFAFSQSAHQIHYAVSYASVSGRVLRTRDRAFGGKIFCMWELFFGRVRMVCLWAERTPRPRLRSRFGRSMSLGDVDLGLDSKRDPPLPMPCAYLPRRFFFCACVYFRFAISTPSPPSPPWILSSSSLNLVLSRTHACRRFNVVYTCLFHLPFFMSFDPYTHGGGSFSFASVLPACYLVGWALEKGSSMPQPPHAWS